MTHAELDKVQQHCAHARRCASCTTLRNRSLRTPARAIAIGTAAFARVARRTIAGEEDS